MGTKMSNQRDAASRAKVDRGMALKSGGSGRTGKYVGRQKKTKLGRRKK